MIRNESFLKTWRTFVQCSCVATLAFCYLDSSSIASSIEVSIEDPGVQQSALFTNPGVYGATNVFVDDFNGLPTGFNSNHAFAGNSSIASYDGSHIVDASPVGGANGTGKFSLVAQQGNVLRFVNPQRYFGFWWSAGDSLNELQFYNDGTLLNSYSTSDVIRYVDGRTAYYGNPTVPFTGQNPTEPYAYLNFFADCENPTVVFDEIRFINHGTNTQFETDNHTIASSYTQISGSLISGCGVPEPSGGLLTVLGAFALFGLRRSFS